MKNFIVIIFIAVISLWVTPCHAQELNWSFEQHPHPGYLEKTPAETAAIYAARDSGLTYPGGCVRGTRAAFDLYHQRYPQFAESGDEETRFKRWKWHIVSSGGYGERHCIIHLPYLLIPDLEGGSDLIFCGRFSGVPITKTDQIFFEIVSEMRDHAQLGISESMQFLMLLNGSLWDIELNPDVDYFVRKWLAQSGYKAKGVETDHLQPVLTPERKAFVDEALVRGDLKSVLETTAPCTPPKQ
jgi:hypothetical protein